MPLEAPKLDTRTFDDLFREARLRIPRYTREWTDFNDSDPGITLLQLYAWLTESIFFQLNRVPERNYVKFLQLLGLELAPARPATVHLTFTATPGGKARPVPRGAQVAAQPPEGGDPVIFETEEAFSPVALALESVLAFDGSAFQDVSAAHQSAGTTFRPLGWVPQVGSALYLGFTPPDPLPDGRAFPREIRFRVFLPRADLLGEAQRCRLAKPAPTVSLAGACGAGARRRLVAVEGDAAASQAPPPPVGLVWEYHPGDGARHWRRLNVFQDGSAAFSREGDLVIEGPSEIAPATVWRLEPRYWLRCRLATGAYPAGKAPEIDLLPPNTVAAVSLSTVREEVLGESEGLPDQSFELRHRPVAPGSLTLRLEGAGLETEEWARRDDLLASGPDDPHYVLRATAGRVLFGDGRNGRIPPAGATVVAGEYRWGGGAAANVASGLVNAPQTPLEGIEKVENPRPAAGGADEQSVDELKKIAPSVLRHRNRAVTPEDFAVLALGAGGVAKATAVALAHPDHPGVEVPGAVTVVVVPEGDDVPPEPSPELLRAVCRHLDRFRLLTTELYVRGPRFLAVRVSARVGARLTASFDAVARDVGEALDRFLDPGRWPFGRDLYPTSLYDEILDVDGVEAVERLELEIDGQPHDKLAEPVVVPADGLVYGGSHEVVVRPAVDR